MISERDQLIKVLPLFLLLCIQSLSRDYFAATHAFLFIQRFSVPSNITGCHVGV